MAPSSQGSGHLFRAYYEDELWMRYLSPIDREGIFREQLALSPRSVLERG